MCKKVQAPYKKLLKKNFIIKTLVFGFNFSWEQKLTLVW